MNEGTRLIEIGVWEDTPTGIWNFENAFACLIINNRLKVDKSYLDFLLRVTQIQPRTFFIKLPQNTTVFKPRFSELLNF